MPRRQRPTSAPLVLGLAVSVIIHVGAFVPMLFAVMTASTEAAPELESDFDAEALAPPTTEPEIELGTEESTQSTLVWLGHEEYQEHLAALSATEQAAFDDRPFGAMPTNPAPPSPQAPEQVTEMQSTEARAELAEAATEPAREPDPLAQPSETELELERETASVEPVLEAPVDAPDAQPTPLPADEAVAPEEPAGVNSAPRPIGEGPSLEMFSQFLQRVLSTAQRAAEEMAMAQAAGRSDEHAAPDEATASASDASPTSEAKESEEEESSQQAPRVTASAPAPPTEQPGEQREAEQSDQESDATSITMDDIKVGKPVVAHGLELKPRKPTLTQLIRMTALPGNPLCEIRFQSNGKPALARLLSSSGDSRVDDAVLASLYRWRASGEQLDDLGDGETIDVRIQIIFNAR